MKKYVLLFVLAFVSISVISQTNTFPASGNVGIGTTSPGQLLEVSSTTNSPQIQISDRRGVSWWLSNEGYLKFSGVVNAGSDNSFQDKYQIGMYPTSSINTNFVIRDMKNSADRLTIQSDGNVGVGTTAPQVHLQVTGTLAARGTTLSNGYVQMNEGTAGSAGFIEWYNNATNRLAYLGYNGGGTGNLGLNLENSANFVINGGNVGIGTTSPSEKLSVNGNIRSKKLIVTQTGWSDYVFNKNYKLKSLGEVENYIKTNKHLPEVPSAKEVSNEGIDVGDNQALLLKKIEELTLYMIQQQKQIEEVQKKNESLEKEVQKLKNRN